mgnify:CR=1 FL=1
MSMPITASGAVVVSVLGFIAASPVHLLASQASSGGEAAGPSHYLPLAALVVWAFRRAASGYLFILKDECFGSYGTDYRDHTLF